MLRIEDALAMILDRTPILPAEEVALSFAGNRILRVEALSDLDLPPFDRARMDGYAVCAGSTHGASSEHPVRLREVGEVAAGADFSGTVNPGEVVRIMTGAPVPAGADAVEKIEVIEVCGDGWIELREEVAAGKNITPRGLEARAGDPMVEVGARITPAVAAVLATFGHAHLHVSRKPRVALLSTGSELVAVEQRPGPGQIRNSNSSALAGYVGQAGAEVVHSAVVEDDFAKTVGAIAPALEVADVVMLSGGVSMGDYDLVKPALREMGAEVPIEKVAMHPGKPTVFAKIGEKVIFGLPGNPVSVAVAFYLFAWPALKKMQGAGQLELPRVRAFCTKRVKGAPPRRSHQPARLRIVDGRAEVEPLKWSGSGDLVGFMRADALLVIPEEQSFVEAGELVDVILLP